MTFTTLATITSFSSLLPVLAIVQAGSPGNGDAYAVLGAVFASTLVLFAHDSASRRQLAAEFLASAACGAFLPGALVQVAYWKKWLAPEFVPSWNVWALLGFVCGALGWQLVQTAIVIATKWLENKKSFFLKK
jgi:drug/metabolite transporter (DMT)-like permease